ncbi:GDSL lipase/acylhydrolase [Ephemerocybe angulata]|uniref:GDSL lipase/acylhydrolase n=1 Tax=Ephemerocybe angulata TaxID=980116 RepID=A0A8H6M277_9AGAR|nr:GDSL lipase/acylhydrolase [Tulosesus angulatus]
MRFLCSPFSTLALLVASLTSPSNAQSGVGIRPKQIKNLVTFGDSYTDVGYSSNGGTPWPIYTAGYAGVKLFPYAKAGATCSNELTYRPFPPLFGSQLPKYFEEKGSLDLQPEETIYTLWIGTNDVGSNALLTGNPGTKASLVAVTDCMVNWVKVLYESGVRNFIFQNMIPLETIPMYAPVSWPNRFWTAERNSTEWSVFMRELVLSGNELTKLKLEALAPTLPGAHIALFDSHSLFADMYSNPGSYLNGTAPVNVTGAIDTCYYEVGATSPRSCVKVEGDENRDSYLWYDELHPSEQADRIVAREIAEVIEGKENRWTSWIS